VLRGVAISHPGKCQRSNGEIMLSSRDASTARQRNSRYSIDDLRRHAHSKGGKCLTSRYLSSGDHYLWQCRNGHRWKAKWATVKNVGTWCKICSAKEVPSDRLVMLTPDQEGALFQAAGAGPHALRDLALIDAMLYWGFRPLELTALTKQECRQIKACDKPYLPEYLTFSHHNQSLTRKVKRTPGSPGYFSQYILTRLTKGDEESVFLNDKGRPFSFGKSDAVYEYPTPTEMSNKIRKILRLADLRNATILTLSNTFIMKKLVEGADCKQLTRLLFERTEDRMMRRINAIKEEAAKHADITG